MLLDLLRNRYSCRDFSDGAISKESIDYILECGRLSASGGNEQPWKFGVVTDSSIRMKIAEAAGVNYQQDWIAKAPLMIVLCTQVFDTAHEEIGMRRFPSIHNELQKMDRNLYACVNMEEHQTKIPGEHMVLAALEFGIYSTWISSIDCERVAQIIGLEGYLVSNVIAFGYPEHKREVTPKKELKDIVFSNYFSKTGSTM